MTAPAKTLPCCFVYFGLTIDRVNYMYLLLYYMGQAPGAEQMRRTLDPILRHGRDNISYLYTLDAFDWTIILLYFTVLGLLAILKAGGAYLPLDASCPRERLASMLAIAESLP